LKHAGKLFLCVARLHNFCINERLLFAQHFRVGGATSPVGFAANDVDDDDNDNDETFTAFLPSDVTVTNIPGNSMMRDILVEKITNMSLCRPEYNLERNAG
jgi:hypothetical protein